MKTKLCLCGNCRTTWSFRMKQLWEYQKKIFFNINIGNCTPTQSYLFTGIIRKKKNTSSKTRCCVRGENEIETVILYALLQGRCAPSGAGAEALRANGMEMRRGPRGSGVTWHRALCTPPCRRFEIFTTVSWSNIEELNNKEIQWSRGDALCPWVTHLFCSPRRLVAFSVHTVEGAPILRSFSRYPSWISGQRTASPRSSKT